MNDGKDFTPAEIVVGLDHYSVTEPLRTLVSQLAALRSITADPPGKGYVAVRPTAWGTVSAYFHATYVDVAVSPGMAEKLHRSRGWKLVKTNSETGFIRVESDALGESEVRELALKTLLAAIDKSEAGTAYEGGKSGGPQASKSAGLCSVHGVEKLGGHCDLCD